MGGYTHDHTVVQPRIGCLKIFFFLLRLYGLVLDASILFYFYCYFGLFVLCELCYYFRDVG